VDLALEDKIRAADGYRARQRDVRTSPGSADCRAVTDCDQRKTAPSEAVLQKHSCSKTLKLGLKSDDCLPDRGERCDRNRVELETLLSKTGSSVAWYDNRNIGT
jgi:hypothetical protein